MFYRRSVSSTSIVLLCGLIGATLMCIGSLKRSGAKGIGIGATLMCSRMSVSSTLMVLRCGGSTGGVFGLFCCVLLDSSVPTSLKVCRRCSSRVPSVISPRPFQDTLLTVFDLDHAAHSVVGQVSAIDQSPVSYPERSWLRCCECGARCALRSLTRPRARKIGCGGGCTAMRSGTKGRLGP